MIAQRSPRNARRTHTNRSKSPHRQRTSGTWVRTPIKNPRGRAVRVLVYARYSTEDQNPRSIDAQIEYAKHFLEDLGVGDFELDTLFDEGVSGEQIWRAGINAVREGITAGRWDLIVCEDSSRLFRDPSSCDELVGNAIDKKIRVICINDFVDTAEEDEWEDRLYEAQRHHSRANRFTIKRIKRAQEDRWASKAAMGPLRSGYRRVASIPATKRERERGPFFDEVDRKWAAVILEAFEKIAAGEATWAVAKWLDERGLPKTNGVTDKKWTDGSAIALIRCERYRGVEHFRETVSTKQHGTGKRRPVENDRDQVLERDMPELRIVPDWLWYAANDAIDSRGNRKNVPKGDDHALSGIPRDSRGPLSKLFFCSRCKEKMAQSGRNEGGYRCSSVRNGDCWNKATAVRALTHGVIRQAVVDHLLDLDDEFGRIINRVKLLIGDNRSRQRRIVKLTAEEQKLDNTCEGLVDGLECAKEAGDSPLRLVNRLLAREGELSRVRAELAKLREDESRARVPTRRELIARRDDFVDRLHVLDRAAGAALGRLVDRIEAVPHQQFGCKLVVLRARFELNLGALLPNRVWLALNGLRDDGIDAEFEKIPIMVNLFEPSTGPTYGLQALKLAEEESLGLTAIGRRLGINKRRANLAVQYGRNLRSAGLTDPYIELTAPPAAASRWRTHPRYAGNGDSEAA